MERNEACGVCSRAMPESLFEMRSFTKKVEKPTGHERRPYGSYQRGTRKKQNGPLRWYLPRSFDLRMLEPDRLKEIVTKINSRPRNA